MNIDINELTLGQVKELNNMMNKNSNVKESNQPFKIGKAYLFRLVTHIDIGVVKDVGEKEIVLTNASWIADTGRYNECFKKGVDGLNEVEPYPLDQEVIIGRGALVDSTIWNHKLPTEAK
tara:strand:+ start:31454 stop:31813 length:360 start_codon:yes stop_codon:yes gene_type:complete